MEKLNKAWANTATRAKNYAKNYVSIFDNKDVVDWKALVEKFSEGKVYLENLSKFISDEIKSGGIDLTDDFAIHDAFEEYVYEEVLNEMDGLTEEEAWEWVMMNDPHMFYLSKVEYEGYPDDLSCVFGIVGEVMRAQVREACAKVFPALIWEVKKQFPSFQIKDWKSVLTLGESEEVEPRKFHQKAFVGNTEIGRISYKTIGYHYKKCVLFYPSSARSYEKFRDLGFNVWDENGYALLLSLSEEDDEVECLRKLLEVDLEFSREI